MNMLSKIRKLFTKSNWIVLLVILILVAIIMSRMSEYFLTPEYLLNSTRFIGETGLIGLGMTVVILTGGIDLSVGSMVALSAITLGMSTKAGLNPFLGILLSLCVGAAGGFLNGIVVTKLNIPALIATLATMGLFRGIALGITRGNAFGIPENIFDIGQGSIASIPNQFIIMLLMYILTAYILQRTKLGSDLKSIGYNEEAARFSGINVTRNKVFAYIFSGLMAALLGVLFACRVSSSKADYGANYEMNAITIAVFGGASLLGGRASVFGSFLAAIIIIWIRQGLTIASIQTDVQQVIIGLILIVSVALNTFVTERNQIR
jgi:rhamnose transport system permease protein